MPRNPEWRDFENLDIAAVFDSYPPKIRGKMMRLRELIFETAATTEGVGQLEETLRWGEPSYITTSPKSGTTIRIDSKAPDTYALYVHCQTDLISRFERLYPDEFRYGGNRSITFDVREDPHEPPLRRFVSWALRYHLDKRNSRGPRPRHPAG